MLEYGGAAVHVNHKENDDWAYGKLQRKYTVTP